MNVKLTSRGIKNNILETLTVFDDFCTKNELVYYLCGGTLLGAVRHKGFIPWDDDIDVCMPRPDYLKLIEMYRINSSMFGDKYKLFGHALNNAKFPFLKIIDITTHIDQKYSEGGSVDSLWIDILPVDGLPDDLVDVKKIYKKVGFNRRVLMLTNARLGEGKTGLKRALKYVLKPMALLYGADRAIAKIDKIAAAHKYEDCTYVGIVTWGLYGASERVEKQAFEKKVLFDFEGHSFPSFSCWDDYLTNLYHNYMELPPKDKRVTHDMNAYIDRR